MTRFWAVTPLLMGLLGVGAARGEETVESIEKKLDAAAEKIGSVSYVIEQRSEIDTGNAKQKSFAKSSVDTKRQGKQDLVRLQVRTETSTGDQKNATMTLQVFDGQALWTYTEEADAKMAVKLPADSGSPLMPRGAAMLTEFKSGGELKVAEGEKDAFVLEWTSKEKAPPAGTPKKRKIWIDADNGLFRKIVDMDASGKEFAETTYKDLKLNPSFPEDHFTLKVPEGVTVLDLTTIGGEAKPGTVEPKK